MKKHFLATSVVVLKKQFLPALVIAAATLPSLCSAQPYVGVLASIPVVTKEPESLHGYQFFVSYDPEKFRWRKFNIYFDAGFTHFWETATPYYSTITIYSIAPVIRYTFNQHSYFRPYLELSIGAAYLNHTRFENRNLGIHYAFQDRMGIGTLIGDRFSVGIHSVHYSNAHLSDHNSGISVPMELDLGYRFPI